jgi:hypothetical protein
VIQQCRCVSGDFAFTTSQLRSVNYTICGNQSSNTEGTVQRSNKTSPLNGFLDMLCAFNVSVNDEDSADMSCDEQCWYSCTENLYDIGISTSGPWPDPCYQRAFFQDYIEDRWFADKFSIYKNISEMFDSGLLSLVS